MIKIPKSQYVCSLKADNIIFNCPTGIYPQFEFKNEPDREIVFGIYRTLHRIQAKMEWFAFDPVDLAEGISPPKILFIQLLGWINQIAGEKCIIGINLWNGIIEVQT